MLTLFFSFMTIQEGSSMEQITLGAGCFWCVEAVFERIQGVHKVESGYSGGETKDPTYKEICTGKTGHAEVVQLTYDPKIVALETILEVFFKTHDPTTLNRQGADVGTQYRSAIFFHSQSQKQVALKVKEALDEAKLWENPIVTEITAFSTFYRAENYHQNYYELNPNQGYCRVVIAPKIEKLEKVFKDLLK